MAGYTRQSVADIVAGVDVVAEPLNREFNQLQAAFHATSGHSHNGSTGNGPKIVLTTSVSGVLPFANGGTNAATAAAARTSIFGISTTVDNTLPRFNSTAGALQTSGVVVSDTNGITGVTTLTTTGAVTIGDKLSFGNRSVVNGYDLSEHLNLYATTYGLSVSGGTLNYVSAGQHVFWSGTNSRAVLSTTGALSIDAGLTATTGTFSSTVTASSFSGAASSLTALNASQLTTGTVPSARVSGSYTSLTGTGVLNAGSIGSGFGAINNGGDGITTSGALNAGSATVTGTITAGGSMITDSYLRSSDSTLILGTNSSGGVYLRPVSYASGTAQSYFLSSGAVIGTALDVNGSVTSSQNFIGSATNVVLGNSSGSGTIHLRPNGVGSSSNATTISSAGDMNVQGSVTATSFSGSGAGLTSIPQSAVTSLTTSLADKADNDISIIAGNGLTGGGTLGASRTLTVGQGTGISVASTTVSVDSTVWRDANLPSAAQINGIIADSQIGQVGTYAFCRQIAGSAAGVNGTEAGSNLRYANGDSTAANIPAGTWRCMGNGSGVGGEGHETLWLRIS